MSHITIPSTHRALVVDSSQSGWEVKEQALPAYVDLLVKVHAAALNPTDWKHVHGKQLKSGSSTGSDFAGVVAAAKGRTSYKAGDRVAGFTRGGFLHQDNGAFAEYISAQTPVVWRIPEGTSFEQAAAIGGIPADTAAQALYTRLDIPRPWEPARKTAVVAGDAILIWSGAASVSYYAIQLAKLSGLKVYTTASKHHHEALTRLGADAVFDYRDPEVAQKIKAASGGAIRVALDGISEFGSTVLAAQALSDEGGKVVSLRGRLEEEYPANVEIVPTLIYSVLEEKNEVDRADIAEWHKYLPKLLEDGKLRVHNIDHQSGGVEAIPGGLAKLREGKVSGQKIVYTISK
ncbi:GroES-like protein [Athelia psychrophila]|uniref:GroES-like protein n=1 Tax=Athelia psychrophila TaxID=1759441 RepID=A0A166N433_9AGAM|nr:GroES-like protein [Fibularhizoctonia sp. CBS 109695]